MWTVLGLIRKLSNRISQTDTLWSAGLTAEGKSGLLQRVRPTDRIRSAGLSALYVFLEVNLPSDGNLPAEGVGFVPPKDGGQLGAERQHVGLVYRP